MIKGIILAWVVAASIVRVLSSPTTTSTEDTLLNEAELDDLELVETLPDSLHHFVNVLNQSDIYSIASSEDYVILPKENSNSSQDNNFIVRVTFLRLGKEEQEHRSELGSPETIIAASNITSPNSTNNFPKISQEVRRPKVIVPRQDSTTSETWAGRFLSWLTIGLYIGLLMVALFVVLNCCTNFNCRRIVVGTPTSSSRRSHSFDLKRVYYEPL